MVPVVAAPDGLRRLSRWLGHARYWSCQAGGWLGLLAITLGTLQVTVRPPRTEIQWSVALMFLTAMVGSHGLRGILPALRGRWSGGPLVALQATTVAGMALLLAAALRAAAPWWLETTSRPPWLWIALQYGFLLGSWLAVYEAVGFYRRDRASAELRLRLESERRDAELRALRTRINPHFLFNSLNTLRALIPRDLERPRTAVTLLADLMRAALRVEEQDLVTLAQEMETVDQYLALEQLRLGERLRVGRDIEPAAAGWAVPPFLVQGLVENAVRHGVAKREAGGVVSMWAAIVDDALQLRIGNPGELPANSLVSGRSLDQTRARLGLLFGANATLELTAAAGGEVVATVVIPRKQEDRKGAR